MHNQRAHSVFGIGAERSRLLASENLKPAFAVAITLCLCAALGIAQAPPVVVSSNQTLVPALGGNTHHIAVNSLGDVFYEDDASNTIFEIAPGNPKPIPLVTGLHGGRSVAVDPSNNLWSVNNYDNGNASIIEIPYSGSNGVYPTAAMPSSLSSTNPPVCITPPSTTPPTSVCQIRGEGGGSVTGYFMQATDLGFDAAGNLYVVVNCDSTMPHGSNGGCQQTPSIGDRNRIVEYPINCTNCYDGIGGALLPNQTEAQYPNLILIEDGLPETTTGELAVDAAGDVYYADGISANVYLFPAGTTATAVPKGTTNPVPTGPYTSIGSGLTEPGGVGVDAFGDLIITDTGNNRLVEVPYASGALDTAEQYNLSYTYSANGVAVDSLGNIYYSGYNANIPPPGGSTNGATTIGEMNLWNANLGAWATGTTSTPSLTLNFVFNAAETPANISVAPAGGSPFAISTTGTGACVGGTAEAQGAACSVQATYTPSAVGVQSGAVVLADSTGKAIATAYIFGTGNGAVQSVDPGTVASIGSNWQSPEGIAIDSAQNVYVADSTASAVYEYSLGGTLLATIGSGLKAPSSVAVDAAGNVYIADAGNGRVVEVPVVNGSLSNAGQIVVYSGTSGPAGLSIDAGGDLYVADSGNKKVWRLPNTGGVPNSALATAVGSGYTAPLALTVDVGGDVFVADSTNVYEVQAITGAQSSVYTSAITPAGIALDASGSLYIADTGNQLVIRIPNENGVWGTKVVVGAGIANPYAVAVDSSANLYITDSTDASVAEVSRSQGTLQFSSFNLGTASGAETATLTNAGNATLTFGATLYSSSGDTGSFTVSDSAAGNCAPGTTLASGFDCTLSAVFDPTKPGTNQETLTFSSSTVTPSSLVLTGQGANLAPTQLSVAATSPADGAAAFGQTVTVTATLTATGGFTTLGAPTGSVNFSVDGQIQGSSQISSTGTASFQLTSLTGGIHAITAAYSGDSNYEASSTATSAAVTITPLATTNSLVIAGQGTNPLSAAPGSSVTLTATIAPYLTPGPSGTVTFLSGSVALGSAPVTAVSVEINKVTMVFYEAILTTTTLPTGILSVVASYGGDANYAASQSSAVALVVSPVGFSITPSTANLAVTDGTPGQLTFTVTSLSGFSGPIAASCSGLPAYSTCGFTFTAANGSIQVGNGYTLTNGVPQQITVEILTGQVPGHPQPPVGALHNPGGSRGAVFLALLTLAPLGLVRRRLWKKYRGWMLLVVALGGLLGAATISGCGSRLNGVTPTGQTTVSLVVNGSYAATASTTVTVTETAQIALTVQQ
ncbi:MAG: Ig-like domain repeat protein [Terracidiphilus sp.]